MSQESSEGPSRERGEERRRAKGFRRSSCSTDCWPDGVPPQLAGLMWPPSCPTAPPPVRHAASTPRLPRAFSALLPLARSCPCGQSSCCPRSLPTHHRGLLSLVSQRPACHHHHPAAATISGGGRWVSQAASTPSALVGVARHGHGMLRIMELRGGSTVRSMPACDILVDAPSRLT